MRVNEDSVNVVTSTDNLEMKQCMKRVYLTQFSIH